MSRKLPLAGFVIQFLILSLASSLPLHSAQAGNGTDRGGGGMIATVDGMIPHVIRRQVDIDFSDAVSKPLVLIERCKLISSCRRAPDVIHLDLTLRYEPSPEPHYETSGVIAHFTRSGLRYFLPSMINKGEVIVQFFGWQMGSLGNSEDDRASWVGLELLSAMKPKLRTLRVSVAEERDGQTLAQRMLEIEYVLIGQTIDFADPLQARELLDGQAALRERAKVLGNLLGTNLLKGLRTPDAIFERNLEADSANFSDLAEQAMAGGSCNIAKYEQLLARARAWKVGIGSPAYFYQMGKQVPLAASTQMHAIGMRHALRNSTLSEVGDRCEPGVAPEARRISQILDDSEIQ